MDNLEELAKIIKGCQRMDKASQERLYRLFYNYAMAVGTRYISDEDEVQVVVNDAFIKVFMRLNTHFDETMSFKWWFRRVIINTALDRYKTKKRITFTDELNEDYQISVPNEVVEQLTREQVLNMVNQLPPQYRTVFNLYVVDGYTHPEIASLLNISEVTSRSNLARARQSLKKLLQENIFN